MLSLFYCKQNLQNLLAVIPSEAMSGEDRSSPFLGYNLILMGTLCSKGLLIQFCQILNTFIFLCLFAHYQSVTFFLGFRQH